MNTSSPSLTEYRCTCGKLLFKGLMLVSVIEIKCKRCGTTHLLRELNGDLIGPTSFGILLDEEGRIVNACKNAVPILGFGINELLSMNIIDINPTITLSFYKNLWRTRHDRDSYTWRKKTFYRAKNGRTVTMSAQYKFLVAGNTPYFFILLDAAPILSEATEFPDDLWFGTGAEIFFVINTEGICVHARGATDIILGYRSDMLVGKPLHEFCPALCGNTNDMRPLCIRNAGKPFDIPHNIFTSRDGKPIPLDSYFICNYENGEFSGYRMFNWLEKAKKT